MVPISRPDPFSDEVKGVLSYSGKNSVDHHLPLLFSCSALNLEYVRDPPAGVQILMTFAKANARLVLLEVVFA